METELEEKKPLPDAVPEKKPEKARHRIASRKISF